MIKQTIGEWLEKKELPEKNCWKMKVVLDVQGMDRYPNPRQPMLQTGGWRPLHPLQG